MRLHPTSMALCDLLTEAGIPVPDGLGEVTVKGISSDSRKVAEGDLFIAIDGLHTDARAHIPEAVARGASAIVCEASEALPVLAEFTDGEGVTHTLRKIADPDTVTRLVNAFADKQLFIADGHHRYETALNFKNHLAENGNPNQWGDSHPAKSVLEDDITKGVLYVVENETGIHGVFAFILGEGSLLLFPEDFFR